MNKIAFLYTPSDSWVGGKNYYLSLFDSLSKRVDNKFNVTIFVSDIQDFEELSEYEDFNIIKSKLLRSKGFFFYIKKITDILLGENVSILPLLKKNKIDIISHSYLSIKFGIKDFPWIADFQHCYLKENFSYLQVLRRDARYKRILKNDNFLLSSYTALSDARKFYSIKGKAHVYRFTPLNKPVTNLPSFDAIKAKFNLPEHFFFLPNQFWKHKNHLMLFKAIKQAIEIDCDVTVVCTGNFNDNRDPDNKTKLLNFINDNDLSKNIILLGLVERNILVQLYNYCDAVINPSLFEGWSTTVEESKLYNKPIILSDIDIHKEQTSNYPNVEYFKKSDVFDCAKKLLDKRVALSYDYFNCNGNDISTLVEFYEFK